MDPPTNPEPALLSASKASFIQEEPVTPLVISILEVEVSALNAYSFGNLDPTRLTAATVLDLLR
jgi:hypothetical protein